jgi:hypothetical protein
MTSTHSAFLKDSDIRAYCSPAYDISLLSPAQLLCIQGVQWTMGEWNELFSQIQEISTFKWLTFVDAFHSPEGVLQVSMAAASTHEATTDLP